MYASQGGTITLAVSQLSAEGMIVYNIIKVLEYSGLISVPTPLHGIYGRFGRWACDHILDSRAVRGSLSATALF